MILYLLNNKIMSDLNNSSSSSNITFTSMANALQNIRQEEYFHRVMMDALHSCPYCGHIFGNGENKMMHAQSHVGNDVMNLLKILQREADNFLQSRAKIYTLEAILLHSNNLGEDAQKIYNITRQQIDSALFFS